MAFFIILGASYNQNSKELSLGDALFYSKENKLVEFSKDSIYFIVLKNNKSCMNCFAVISDYLTALKNENDIKLMAVSHSDSTSLARKRNIYEARMTFPGFSAFGVTYSSRWDESSPTPELLIIKNNNVHEFSYSEIFAEGFGFISLSAQERISAFINTK